MIVAKNRRKLLVKSGDMSLLGRVLPSASPIQHNGEDYLVVPHELDETRVLNNMGIKAPSPVSYYYKWSGQYTPFEAQRKTVDFLTMNPKSFCLNEMGLGKSITTLWAFDYLRSIGVAKKLLVVAPLSTLERTWADEVFTHFWHLNAVVLHGTRKRRLKLLNQPADIYIINHDGIAVIQEELQAMGIDTVAVDEIASFRNAKTMRFKSLNSVTKLASRVWGLTGTPTPNAPTDAWAQCKLICPENVPKYYSLFRDQTMRQVTPFKWAPRDDSTEIVAKAMQPAVRFRRDDCLDLPPCLYENRKCLLSPEQDKAYKQMLRDLKAEHNEKQITASNEAVKLGKLVQIAAGVAYSESGEAVLFGATAKVNELKEIIEQAGGKVIVFVTHRAAIDYVASVLDEPEKVGIIHGGVSKHQRDKIFHEFQRGNTTNVLVAQPGTMAHGLTLTASNTIVWFSPPTSTETYIQANARITRPGQTQNQFIINLESTPLEARMYEKLKKRQSIQGVLLDTLMGVV